MISVWICWSVVVIVLNIYCRCVLLCRTLVHGATWPVSTCQRRQHPPGTIRQDTPLSCKREQLTIQWAMHSTLRLPSQAMTRAVLHLVWAAWTPWLPSTHQRPPRWLMGGEGDDSGESRLLCATGPASPSWTIFQILPRKHPQSHCHLPHHK